MNSSHTNSTVNELESFTLTISSASILSLQIINFCLGLPLNICVIILLFKAGKLDGAVIFSLSQAITEILFALEAPLFVLCHINIRNLCFLMPVTFFTGVCMSARFLFQCCLCVERYLAVVHPVTFLKHKSIKYRLPSLVFLWIYSFITGIVSVTNLSTLPYPVLGVLYIIILCIHLFLCFSILRVLRTPRPGEGERKDGGVSDAKKKAFELVFFSLLIFSIQTIPLAVAFGVKDNLSSDAFTLAFTITMDFNIAAGTAQPVLVLHQMGKLKFTSCV